MEFEADFVSAWRQGDCTEYKISAKKLGRLTVDSDPPAISIQIC